MHKLTMNRNVLVLATLKREFNKNRAFTVVWNEWFSQLTHFPGLQEVVGNYSELVKRKRKCGAKDATTCNVYESSFIFTFGTSSRASIPILTDSSLIFSGRQGRRSVYR